MWRQQSEAWFSSISVTCELSSLWAVPVLRREWGDYIFPTYITRSKEAVEVEAYYKPYTSPHTNEASSHSTKTMPTSLPF